MTTAAASLSPSQRATVAALARCIVPHAFEAGPAECSRLPALVEARISNAPPATREELLLALRILDSRAARFALSGRAAPWGSLGTLEASERFAKWAVSLVPQARTIHQALRRLILATYYGTPQGRGDIGVLPPLATRIPRMSWEGPLEGDTNELPHHTESDEAIARVAGAARRPVYPRDVPPFPDGAITVGASVGGDLQLTADAVVVGSGAGGAVAAARLAESGMQVVILESGPWVPSEDLNEDEERLTPMLFAEQGLRTTSDLAVSLLQGVGVGGGTRVNWMIMLRTPDHVLDEWQRSFGITGYDSATLAAVFERIEAEVRAAPVPDEAHSPTNRIIIDGARALGWRASAALINARGCVRAGTCSLGCRYGAKQDALATFLPRAFARGAHLYADVHVSHIEQMERASAGVRHPMKRVRGRLLDPTTGAALGKVTVRAPIVVLAAGAVETPALLQRSTLGGGGVGRYLRLHPTTCVTGLYEREMYPMAGIPLSAMCDEFITRGPNGYGYWIEAPAFSPVLAAVATSGFGATHRGLMQRLHQTATIISLVRDGADREMSNGEITLKCDGSPRIAYRLGPSDRKTLSASLEGAARLHFASGATEVRTLHTTPVVMHNESELAALNHATYGPNRISLFSAHLNGTCRMGTNPAISGATPEGERHGIRGVYVCDGSLLPTAPGVNPQETIMALSSLIAEGIVSRA
ncbi:MAG: GMC family oxidoreductase [Gemmatimonadaceae bacterium]